MPENGLGFRAAALVSVMLLASMFVLYTTARATSATANYTTAVTTSAEIPVKTDGARRDQVLPLLTAALRNQDFTKARQIIEALPNAHTRDQFSNIVSSAEHNQTSRTITSAVRAARFSEARSAAAKFDDEAVRDEIRQVIDFADSRHALTSGDAGTAAALAKSLHPGIKRALLFTAIAVRVQAAGDRASSLAHLQSALADVPCVAQHHRRQVLVMIARVLVTIDVEKGLDVLDRALHENTPAREQIHRENIGMAGTQFYETISVGGSRSVFSLVLPGVRGDLEELLLAYHGRLRCRHGSGETRGARLAVSRRGATEL